MRKIANTILLAAVVLLMTGCDLIKENNRSIKMEPVSALSRSLLIEFTGFRCVNCPNAATEAHSLLDAYSDNLVVVEMHPAASTFTKANQTEYNYTCPDADSIFAFFEGTSATSFPTGRINFSGDWLNYQLWNTVIARYVSQEANALLTADAIHTKDAANPKAVTLTWHPEVFLDDNTQDGQMVSLKLLLWLVEDSIVGPQMMPDGSSNDNYVHNHVLRTSLTESVWGVADSARINLPDNGIRLLSFVIPETTAAGQTINASHTYVVGVLLDADWNFLDVKRIPIVWE